MDKFTSNGLIMAHLHKLTLFIFILALIIFFPSKGLAQDKLDECILQTIKSTESTLSIQDVKERCAQDLPPTGMKKGRIANRIISEKRTAFDAYVITPHKMNYILPVSYSTDINRDAYKTFNEWGENLHEIEAKFQLSIKVPLNTKKLFTRDDGLFFGFTLQSWWQLYSDGISKPFRETNYQPEIFYLSPLRYHPFDGNTAIVVGFEHQSNGRTQGLSRSWNRVYLNFLFEKGDFALSFQPWWRVPEGDKDDPLDPDGDDNPDIRDYMGNFQLASVYKWDDYELSIKGRQNFTTHKGGFEFGLTFPLWGKLRGYLQYTNGYGESLIDYNHDQQTLGLGIALTNVI
jgi:phospholipase A1